MDKEKLLNAMAELDEDTVLDMMRQVIQNGGADAQKALEACQEGMDVIGKRFEDGEYFVGDLIYAGEVMTDAMNILKPALAAGNEGAAGRLILCTVKNDLHDIGKNIVKAMLEAGGFQVLDLGIDVAPEAIVEAAKKDGVKIVALSGVLTLALDSMRETVEAFRQAGLREDVKIIIGGSPVSEEACRAIGADEWAYSPQKTVKTCREWTRA